MSIVDSVRACESDGEGVGAEDDVDFAWQINLRLHERKVALRRLTDEGRFRDSVAANLFVVSMIDSVRACEGDGEKFASEVAVVYLLILEL